jgi:hypothetical protein
MYGYPVGAKTQKHGMEEANAKTVDHCGQAACRELL